MCEHALTPRETAQNYPEKIQKEIDERIIDIQRCLNEQYVPGKAVSVSESLFGDDDMQRRIVNLYRQKGWWVEYNDCLFTYKFSAKEY